MRAQYSAGQWAFAFFLYSFAGWCWEVALYLVRERRFVNRGFLSGPFLPVYGFGALGMLLVCLPVKEHVGKVAIVGMLAASALEYAAGALLHRLLHVRCWDYSGQRMNLHGYICLTASLTWALFSVAVVCILHPLFQPLFSRMHPLLAGAAAGALAVFCLRDAPVRRSAGRLLRRWTAKRERTARGGPSG